MTMKSSFAFAASVAALGVGLALQPVFLDLSKPGIRVAQVLALDLGGSAGGAVGGAGNAGGPIGGAAGGVSDAIGGALGGSVGSARGESTANAGGAVSGAIGGSVDGAVSGTAGADVSGAVDGNVNAGVGRVAGAGTANAVDPPSAFSDFGFLGALFGGPAARARSDAQAAVQAMAHATASYEQAMLQGNVKAAAGSLVQITPEITATTVNELNARLSIEASNRFVTALVQEARKLQSQARAEARRQAAKAVQLGTDTARNTQQTAHATINATAEKVSRARAQVEAEAYGTAMLAGDVQAAARSYVRLAGAAATEADVRRLNAQLGLQADQTLTAAVAAAAQQQGGGANGHVKANISTN